MGKQGISSVRNVRSDKIMFMKLFDEYSNTYNKVLQSMIEYTTNEIWDGKRQSLYSNGPVLGKYRENDPETLKTIEVIKQSYSEEKLRDFFISYFRQLSESKKDQDVVGTNKNILTALYEVPLENWVIEYFPWIVQECEKKEIANLIQNSLSLAILYFSYDLYCKNITSVYCFEQNNIRALYGDSIKLESQYEKYELVTINEDREFLTINPARIYDSKLQSTVYLHNVPYGLAVLLNELHKKNWISLLSFRLSNNNVFRGKVEESILLENIEFGKKFSLNIFNNVSITKLYSDSFEDSLWVKIDNNNITFEELCEDFLVSNNQIITQVVHLQYKQLEGNYYITHIDHEYIFYTLDQYERRLTNSDQKGNASPRMKTFKADNCKIPFNSTYTIELKDSNGVYLPPIKLLILHYILESYFRHTNLLCEYFENIEL